MKASCLLAFGLAAAGNAVPWDHEWSKSWEHHPTNVPGPGPHSWAAGKSWGPANDPWVSRTGHPYGPTKTASASPTTSTSASGPCATVSSLVAQVPFATGTAAPRVPAELALACMKSVPFNAKSGYALVVDIRPYINWQTDLSYLKNPPPGYLLPPVDVLANYDAILAKTAAGSYENEYDFELALYKLFQTAYDGHFRYYPDLIGGIFAFGRPEPLVSVSDDGVSLPKAYVYSDILTAANDTTFTPSAVVTIDGQDAAAYLESWSLNGILQDPDALYNNVFVSLAQLSLGSSGIGVGTFGGAGRGAYVYPGASTTFTFENGSTSTFENFARVLVDFQGVSTGRQLYDTYLDPPPSTTSSAAAATSSTPTSTPAPGYPPPVIRQNQNLIGGYYLSDPAYADVAVLSVPSFVGVFSGEESFQDVGFEFIQQAKADGKTRLIIDVSANGGGTILQGYNLFTELFPDLFPYGATRFRTHEAFDLMGQVVSAAAGPVYPWDPNDPANEVLNEFIETPFDYRADVDVNYEPFPSWAAKNGPHTFNGDTFSSIIRWNLSDPFSLLGSGIVVTGFQNRTGLVTSRPFAAENIVIMYDGYCASTCTIFSELMRQQGGVKTIAFGGRPQAGIIQAVGGVKGTNDYTWGDIYELVNSTFALVAGQPHNATTSETDYLNSTELGLYSDYPLYRASSAGGAINVRDGLREGDANQVPLQFYYEPADCRILYTPEMTVSVETQWTAAADSMWADYADSKCVAGDLPIATSVDSTTAASLGKRVVAGAAAKPAPPDVEMLMAALDLRTDLRGNTLNLDGWVYP